MDDQSQDIEDPQESLTINFKPSYVIVAIDTHSSMFKTRETDASGETHFFKDALTACFEIADSLLLATGSNSFNQFGVLLADEDHKASLIEVESNMLDSIKFLKEESGLSNAELKTKYERQSSLDVAAFFLLCKKKFKSIISAYYKRTIVFITNNDDPVDGDAQRKFTALNEAKTFEGNSINFEIVSMINDFDYTKFYNELFHLYSEPPTTDVICQDKHGIVEKLLPLIVFRYTKLRTRFYPFENDYGRHLNVMKMNFIRKARLLNNQKASVDGRMLKTVHVLRELGSNKPNPFKYRLRLGVGEEPLRFNEKDRYDIEGNDLPLGFHFQYVSDRQSEAGVVVNKTSILAYDPKEDLEFFQHFWQYCFDRNQVMVCIKKYRNPAPIRYVELIPKFANNQRLFLIKNIPFAGQCHPPKAVVLNPLPDFEVSVEKKDMVRLLIKGLSFDYSPKTFTNLSYAKKKAYVKSKLLDEPLEEVEDVFGNAAQSIDKEIGEVANRIKTLFNLPDSLPRGRKRKAPSALSKGKRTAK
ncbi:uncharacterized protein LOC115890027 [Sitophilus oryzae]|uniref:Uncharacterized protein LOC115890027 n=1 Tax=Sitophilus oryzae TaxID=7048 RepID=A0A6J2YRQ4_SITOR|nr:uncharacterized protein LOC115890027 [Sitophilus oryzae]XP_030765991.1 uncharacterized protein LOC115890027 [Sitophilus oryzae]XP_030765992.1 uncharacterized protein LOC115890027 [Sitophilus oryzae]XP_030765993.1 uncharacterized protein LOC115890027 [Sitophilus oryzae]XP_030765994.1 uncharacterized protein LOC115890027 [Sitophilus oryzae]